MGRRNHIASSINLMNMNDLLILPTPSNTYHQHINALKHGFMEINRKNINSSNGIWQHCSNGNVDLTLWVPKLCWWHRIQKHPEPCCNILIWIFTIKLRQSWDRPILIIRISVQIRRYLVLRQSSPQFGWNYLRISFDVALLMTNHNNVDMMAWRHAGGKSLYFFSSKAELPSASPYKRH